MSGPFLISSFADLKHPAESFRRVIGFIMAKALYATTDHLLGVRADLNPELFNGHRYQFTPQGHRASPVTYILIRLEATRISVRANYANLRIGTIRDSWE